MAKSWFFLNNQNFPYLSCNNFGLVCPSSKVYHYWKGDIFWEKLQVCTKRANPKFKNPKS